MKNNYEVGYAKPPRNTQFKPGESGNCKGRPKGKNNNNFFELLDKELKEPVTLSNGKKISKEEAVVKQVCNKASSGDYRSSKLILDTKSKQEKNSLANRLLDKLIREGFIGEESVEKYVNKNLALEMHGLPPLVHNLYRASDAKHIIASEAVRHNFLLSSLWRRFDAFIEVLSIVEDVFQEYYFWKGVDTALDSMKLNDLERQDKVSEIEKTREYVRPSDDIYNTANSMVRYFCVMTSNHFVWMRDILHAVDYFQEKEELSFGEKKQQEIYSKALSKMPKNEYETFEKDFKKGQEGYKIFGELEEIRDLKREYDECSAEKLITWWIEGFRPK